MDFKSAALFDSCGGSEREEVGNQVPPTFINQTLPCLSMK
jgi:hypothetical protein